MEEKTEVQGFFKVDESTVINKDTEALDAYKKRKKKVQKINQMEEDIADLKSSVEEIKNLLKGLVK